MSETTLLKTLVFAANKHRDQRRKDVSKTPYINHPISVANILATEGNIQDIGILQAALLHDTVEDTNTTLEELRSTFGDRIANIVAAVTDDKSLPKHIRKQHQVEHTKHMSDHAKLVKMADKIDNLRDLQRNPPPNWSPEYVQGYFIWSRAVMANCKGLNSALEAALDELFSSLPIDENDELLAAYYKNM